MLCHLQLFFFVFPIRTGRLLCKSAIGGNCLIYGHCAGCNLKNCLPELQDCIVRHGGALLQKVNLFDVYRGAPIEEGKKSVAFSLEFRAPDRTLTGADTDAATEDILNGLKKELNAVIR